MYDGIQSEVIRTTRFDENSEISTKYGSVRGVSSKNILQPPKKSPNPWRHHGKIP